MRVEQPAGKRGSLKWIQRAVNEHASVLDAVVLPALSPARAIEWVSPRSDDAFAEYRDAAFLDVLGCSELGPALAEFWPGRGPQWDALGRSDRGDLLLVEAKAHVGEILSPASQAGPESRARIEAALNAAAKAVGAEPRAPWVETFYQLGNRIAHLEWFTRHNCSAWLVLANFVGDEDMGGPKTAEAWHAAYEVVWHVMGVPARSPIMKRIIHAEIDVALLR